jgi:hypothetical protein
MEERQMTTPTLEQRISATLAAERASVEDVQALIVETEQAISEADAAAKKQHALARDLGNDDPMSALFEAQASELTSDRLSSCIAKLEQKLAEACAFEYRARWQADYTRIKGKRNAAAERLQTLSRYNQRTDRHLARTPTPSGGHERGGDSQSTNVYSDRGHAGAMA